ncbi:MAG: TonB-dependent receptor [Bacteroidota bacterium]|nr:TonB-dependent receptor [Bacteroidota bacterium]
MLLRSFFTVICCIAFLMVFIPASNTPLLAQSVGKISGTVTDAETSEALVGCTIEVKGTRLGASTDVDGSYFILNVPPGEYDLQASMIGYQKVLLQNVIVDAGKTTTASFKLTSAAVQQKEVVVESVRPDVEPEKTSTSAIVRSEDVQTVAGIRDIGDVLALEADVTDGHFRGGRTGEEYYTLQGMGIVNPLDNSSAFLPIMSAVEEVEVITSGFGAQYGNAQSGVVNISMKEGKSDTWRTRVETRMRAPGKKHFGPSVYDPNANPYLAALLNGDQLWKTGDPSSPSQTPYYTNFFSSDRYAGDTIVQLAVAKVLWKDEMHRDLNRNYGNNIDHDVEVATGGPIDENMRMFAAFRSQSQWPVFPTEEPDMQLQMMGNVASDLGDGATLRISGGYTKENTNLFPSSNGLGFYTWLWDRILGTNYQERTNLQLGARFTHALSAATFYEVKVNSLWTHQKVGSSPSPGSVSDSLITNAADRIDWDKVIPQVVSGPDKFYYLRGDDNFRDQMTRTISLDASMTSQVTRSHLLNGGVQFNAYHIDVSNSLSVRNGSGGPVDEYNVYPYEGALYAQDKMEFEGLIANMGLRFDLWNVNTPYYPDVVVPYRRFNNAYPGDTTFVYGKDSVQTKKTPMLGRLQPRLGISFPVFVNTVFHLNYGSFVQRPPFQYVVGSEVQQGSDQPITFGNPRLQPEETNSYDIGVTQGLGEGFTLDVSGYYKDVKNLIEQATFTSDKLGQTYTTYFNRDYADIRGFRVALTKRRGAFTGSINYQFGVATGKSATTSFAPPAYVESPTYPYTIATKLDNVPVRDILLDFDRTHHLIINLAYHTDDEGGPELFGGYPLSDLTLSVLSTARSGRPYTDPYNPKFINGARTPAEYNTDARLTKRFADFFGVAATLYLEAFNLFDQKILNYGYLFATPNAGSTNNITKNYENYPINDPVNGVRYYQDLIVRPAWAVVDQSFLIYDNTPRSFDFGIVIEF